MARVQVQEVDFKALAEKLAGAVRAIRRDCREVLEGREALTMTLIHAICNGKARAALAEYHAAVTPPEDHPGWNRLETALERK